MSDRRRLLVLALDAASPALLRRWAADGTMPALGRLLARGRVADTRSVDGFFVGATWPSFFTGRDPGEHGIYWLDRILPGSYRRQEVGAGELGRWPALWDVLEDAGHRSIVLDVPLAPPSDRVRGPQVTEWGVHDAVFGFRTRPVRLAREIESRHGLHPAPRRCDARRSPGEARAFADLLMKGAARRASVTGELLDAERTHPGWDFAIQVFSETHCAGHQLWHYHDSTHPAYDPDVTAEVGDLVRDVYAAVDRAVGELVDSVGPGVTVAVVSLHGMGPSGGGSLLLPEILRRMGVEAPSPPARGETSGSEAAGPAKGPSLLRRLYHRLPESIRAPVHRLRQRGNQAVGRGSPLDLDPARTRAFHEGLGLGAPFSAIRLNVRGREPKGILEPGGETDRFVDELRARLGSLTDPRTGVPLVRGVTRTSDLYGGPAAHELPDLLVEWDMSAPRGTTATGDGRDAEWEAESDELGRIAVTNRYCRTGEHRPEGLVVVAGEGIPAGRLDRTLSVTHLAPTFADWLGCESPGMPGTPVRELFGS